MMIIISKELIIASLQGNLLRSASSPTMTKYDSL